MTRLLDFGKAVLIALVPGAVLPTIFFLLFSMNTTATRRDILPPLDNPLEIIGCAGSAIFSAPIFLMFVLLAAVINTVHANGLIIPIYDALSSQHQTAVFLAICLASNVLLWTVPISLVRLAKRHSPSTSTVLQDHGINE